ncbi:hypothetical protein FHT40_002228 [Mycolicibacterium sp. BK556]|uniref:hypothetical protein n=1 Tax=Mycobacteriaceae TaxID=1762 RepID=UPI001061D163|nr:MULTISPECIES: hypothetical protein [Mycobacteriaceae]MBB3602595.1 hypothetical protein [Mycolicibacterium sp. BK556]MBB3632347.1 hypothetical protein [Mycolicibacterium sp. BK607]TDO18364.1 hypothetical protein EV580_1551 [Mycobacterium sp. BK086]
MSSTTAKFGVAGMARRGWSYLGVVATPSHAAHAAGAAAISAQPKRRANAAPTIASVDRSFI